MCIRTASAPRTSTKIGTVPLEAHDLKKLRSKGTLRGNGKTLEDARTVTSLQCTTEPNYAASKRIVGSRLLLWRILR